MCIGSYADISVHAPTRGATSNSLSFSIFSVFQSTLPREERLLGLNFKEANSIFQSTLPREERPSGLNLRAGAGTDFNPRSHERSDGISPVSEIKCSGYFNPRSHERSDGLDVLSASSGNLFQSTLPREERQRTECLLSPLYNFNPRSHERSDDCLRQ